MEYRPYNLLGPTLIGAIATEVTAAHEAASRRAARCWSCRINAHRPNTSAWFADEPRID
jgi:hypothetical protein